MGVISRRRVVEGLAAGVVIAGFAPGSESWITQAQAAGRASTTPGFESVPPLDGTLTLDPSAVAPYADDFGHIVHRTPTAVLLPGSAEDIARMVRFCRANGVRIASRGKGHTPFGQSQVGAGLSIDMTTLDTIHAVGPDSALVDAGVLWGDLLTAALAIGRTPPILTDYTRLTVGGTLSVGGVSGSSYLHGAQVDNVLSLQVVTGEGEIVTCSRTENRSLFDAALAGLGLVAVIVRAEVRLVPAKQQARTHRVFYPDVTSMLADMRFLVSVQRFDHLRGNAQPTPGGWVVYLEGTSFYTPEEPPDGSGLGLPSDPFAGLHYLPGSEMVEEQSYFDFCDAIRRLVDFLDMLGLSGLPHPWLDLFVPDDQIDAFASSALAGVEPAQQIPGSIALFYGFRGSVLEQPMLRVPDGEVFFLFDLLLTAPPDPAAVAAALQRNRQLYDLDVAIGGAEYTISAVEMSARDWRKHFLDVWGQLVSAKRLFDPDNVLGGGLSIFG